MCEKQRQLGTVAEATAPESSIDIPLSRAALEQLFAIAREEGVVPPDQKPTYISKKLTEMASGLGLGDTVKLAQEKLDTGDLDTQKIVAGQVREQIKAMLDGLFSEDMLPGFLKSEEKKGEGESKKKKRKGKKGE